MEAVNPEPAVAAPRPGRRKRRIVRVLAVLAGIAAAGLVYVWFFLPPRVASQPYRVDRGADGLFHRTADEPGNSGVNIPAHAATLKSQHQMSSATTSSNSNPAYFSAKSYLVMNLSDNLLMKRVGEELVELLKADPQVERIEYFPFGHRPEQGAESPDLFLTLDLASIDESGLLGRDLKVKVAAALGTALASSHSSYNDHFSPPVVEMHTRINLNYTSTLLGVESSQAEYVLQGKDIAKQLANSVAATVKATREKHDQPQVLPASFSPPYRETPQLAFLEVTKSELLGSFHGLMSNNDSYWTVEDLGDPAATLAKIHDTMKSAGWTDESNWPAQPSSDTSLRMTQGAATLEAFCENTRDGFTSDVSSDEQGSLIKPVLYVHYCDRMGATALEAAFGDLAKAEPPNLDLLLALRRYANNEQRNQLMERVEKNPPLTVGALSALAEIYVDRKDKAAAERTLRQLYHVSYLSFGPSEVQKKIEEHAKKLEINLQSVTKLDPAVFTELGFQVVNLDAPPQPVDVPFGQIAGFYAPFSADDWYVITVKVEQIPQAAGAPMYKVEICQNSPGMRSQSTSSFNLNHAWDEGVGSEPGRRLRVRIEKHDDKSVRVVVQRDPMT